MNSKAIQEVVNSCQGRRIVAASKYLDSQGIKKMLSIGFHDFGENRVDAFLTKYEELKEESNLHWHFIGHLQSNKAKLIANKISCLHSLDSLKLARILNGERTSPLPCFIELHLTDNEAKSGVKEEDLPAFIEGLKEYPKIQVIGFMAMSDKEMSEEQKKTIFSKAKSIAERYGYKELSMGMSDDYLLAIECGATVLRLGRILTNLV